MWEPTLKPLAFLQVAKAYKEGGCAQLGVSRAKHLKALKEAFPNTETLLTRSPTRGDLEDTARYADLSLHADKDVLKALNDEAVKHNTFPGVILMLDVGDLREGVDNIPELVELAVFCESLPNLRPLSSPSPLTFNLSQHQGLFKSVSSSHQVAKDLELQLQHQSFQ